MKLWRISNYADLSGQGGIRFSARWHSKGRPIIYAAEHPAGALAEFLVHIDVEDIPERFQLLTLEISDEVAVKNLPHNQLPKGWAHDVQVTRALGNNWLETAQTLLLRVPSVIVPDAYNVLINPNHADASKMRIIKSQKVPLDRRLT